MLRLRDAATGAYAEVRPARPGLLRVCAHVPATAGGGDLTALRVLLAADVLARAAELRRLQVLTALASQGPTEALERAADALGIHPPAARTGPGETAQAEAVASLGGPIDLHLTSSADAQGGLVARVGAARLSPDAPDPDPLAVRLALLGVPWHAGADLTQDALAAARQTLADWRRLVARWAQSPSRPIPAPVADQVRAALDDLDTVAALALLRGLASDEDMPPGARFETFVYTDRVLGLELPRDIGT